MSKRSSISKITIRTEAELEEALTRLEEIRAEVLPLEAESVTLKKEATAYAVKKKIPVIQLDGVYYRKIERVNRSWDDDLVKKILKGIMVNGKPLWNKVTRRVIDPDKLAEAVALDWVTEEKLDEAYVESAQAPFLQRYVGDAD